MRPLSLSKIFLLTNIFLSLLASTCHSAERKPNITGDDLEKCAEYARMIADLGETRHKINESKGNVEQPSKRMKELSNTNKISKEYEEKIESTCPGVGFECETFSSRPEKNICKPFKIRTNDRFILKNNTYK
jgi:hypothetical protein